MTTYRAAAATAPVHTRSRLLPLSSLEALYLLVAAQAVLLNPTLVNVGSLRVYLSGITWAFMGCAALANWMTTTDDTLLAANRRLAVASWACVAAVAIQLLLLGLQDNTAGSLVRLLYAPLGIFAAFAVYRRIDRLVDAIVGLVGVECAMLVVPTLGSEVALATRLDPPALGGRNVFGAFLMALIVLRVSMWAYTRVRPPWYVLAGLASSLCALILTLARSPVLGLAAGLTTVSVSSMRRRGITGRSLRAGGVILALLSPLLTQSAVRSRLTALSPADASGRSEIWTAAWQSFAERPVFGHGFGSFTVTSPHVVEDFVTAGKYGPAMPGVPQPTSSAHNAILQVMAEGGLIGLGIVVWSVWYLLRTCWHAVIGPVLVALFVDSLFDTFAYVVQVSWVLGLVFSTGLKFRYEEEAQNGSPVQAP